MYLEQYNHWMKTKELRVIKDQLEKMTDAEKEDAFYRSLEFWYRGNAWRCLVQEQTA